MVSHPLHTQVPSLAKRAMWSGVAGREESERQAFQLLNAARHTYTCEVRKHDEGVIAAALLTAWRPPSIQFYISYHRNHCSNMYLGRQQRRAYIIVFDFFSFLCYRVLYTYTCTDTPVQTYVTYKYIDKKKEQKI